MARARAVAAIPAEEPTAAGTAPCTVHLRRADGLDLEVAGPGPFVTATLERLLVALGVVPPPG
jgi:hypothetical protein